MLLNVSPGNTMANAAAPKVVGLSSSEVDSFHDVRPDCVGQFNSNGYLASSTREVEDNLGVIVDTLSYLCAVVAWPMSEPKDHT